MENPNTNSFDQSSSSIPLTTLPEGFAESVGGPSKTAIFRRDEVSYEKEYCTKSVLVSLGYRCSTAGIIKQLGRKNESYPFDWMISRLPVVRDCIETRFRYFIDPQYYVTKQTHTTHYHKGSVPTPMKICDETIYENEHYQGFRESVGRSKSAFFRRDEVSYENSLLRIPKPLSIQNGDTYAHVCAMNHRDIHTKETQEYYERCIRRLYELYETPSKGQKVIGIYIHPTITEEEYAEQSYQLIDEFRDFYDSVLSNAPGWSAAFFIMVRTVHPYPITDYKPKVIECVESSERMQIYVVYTNCDFIDAGEIFMQNAYIETDQMCELIGKW